MAGKQDVQQGTLALMILRTLEVLGPLHGYGISRRIEETSRAPVGEQPPGQILRAHRPGAPTAGA